ncbi:MAG: NFACT RNA binding domain-containing protein [Eubacteriales bacterium]|nr:NFACT RNA binding domain-containing protein [Christensenellaceae bacterium]MDY5717982.1 NFACT RNA binding domain-containing protein [Eubacteriales bacterium]
MSMDGLSLYSAMNELNKRLAGGKIDKIQQTDKEELLLMVRSLGQTYRLLINASAADNRVQLTELKKQAPSEAPMFCMLLRKRIAGGKIVRFEQERLDRVLKISIETYNDLGDLSVFALYCELMGKHSNIILVNEKGVIVDAIKHVGLGMSSVRFVMPGLEYSAPPAQDKQDPSKASADDFSMAMCMVGMSIAKALSNAFFGLSPAVAAQLVARYTNKTECTQLSEAEREELAERLAAFYADMAQGKEKASAVLNALGETEAVYPFAIAGGGIKLYDSIGEALDSLYINSDRREWAKRHGASARKVLQNNIERCEKKLALYADALNSGEQMEKCRLYGELLTANLHSLKSGTDTAAVDNYYADPVERIAIPLDRQLTPGENAQRYYKKYQKLKAARDMAIVQREQTLSELNYLEGQLDNLTKCTAENELSELIEELKEQGYIKRDKGGKKKMKLAASKPMHFVSSTGADIYVGKNNRQNDELTLRFASPNDIWMHAKNIPGSHVIVKGASEQDTATMTEAALLAAYYSRARGSENVAVDYTPRKYVKKPAGAKPGMVIYTTNKTAYVTPSEEAVAGLKER